MRFATLSALVAGLALSACSQKEAPKVPLGSAQAAPGGPNQPPMDAITGEARVALDSGNVLFRAKAYDQALAQYERAAKAAPTELAPLLGIMMVADVTKNSKLAETTLPRIRKIDPSAADSSILMPHSKVIESHPKTPPPDPRT